MVPSQSGYPLFAWDKCDITLLRVSRQIHEEAYPVLYGQSRFVIDASASSGLLFLDTLPGRYRSLIRSLGVADHTVCCYDLDTRLAWSISDDGAPYYGCALPLLTPFAAYLAWNLPRLHEVLLRIPCGDDADSYCTFAPHELRGLLRLGKIGILKLIFIEEDAAEALRECKASQSCYDRLVGLQKYIHLEVACEEFESMKPHPFPNKSRASARSSGRRGAESPDDQLVAWNEELSAWLGSTDRKMIQWCWGGRDIVSVIVAR